MHKHQKNLIWSTVILAVLMAIVMLLPWQDALIIKILRIVFGSVYVLFLPGYWTSISFFDKKEIDRLERFALSFALSISVVPLFTFYTNLMGLKITQMSVWGVVTFVIVANIVYIVKFKKETTKPKA